MKFQWATYKMNRELPRSLSHLCLLLPFLLFGIFGNPFAQVDVAVRLTILAGIGSWLVVRDIFPTPDTEKSVGWALAALGSALLTGFLLTWSHFWNPWTGTGAWIMIALGLYLSFLVTLDAFLRSSPVSKRAKGKFLARPICRWYVLGLGIGLLSCSLAGVWLGVSFALVVWGLHIGRWIAIHSGPQGIPIGISLFILVAASGGAAVLRQLQ